MHVGFLDSAAIIAAVSSPFHLLKHACFPKAAMLTVVRLMLGSICWLAMFAQVTGVAGYLGLQIPRSTQQLVKVIQAHGLPFSITLAPEVFILIKQASFM
ncbi:hypothetical protein WJX79_006575 [Trebouxia sp. C0005]